MLKKFTLNNLLKRPKILVSSLILISNTFLCANSDIEKLKNAYPNFIKDYSSNYIIWNDDEKMIFDDLISNKSFEEKLNNPSLKDQLSIKYIKTIENKDYIPSLNEDAGRIRYEPFFKKMYGKNEREVNKNLVKIPWMPKYTKRNITVTKINDIDKKLINISSELENLPKHLRDFVLNPDGAYNWRKIANSNNISVHSFGIALDINVKNSNYWLWDKGTNKKYKYKNQIPLEIVEIFEKHGFIWGGRWYHYDTMHFEYRPELLN